MTKEQIEYYNKASEEGTIPDDLNPLYILRGVHIDLLVKIIHHDFNLVDLARHDLRDRGLNDEGKWVGFNAADEKKEVKKIPPGKRKSKGKGL